MKKDGPEDHTQIIDPELRIVAPHCPGYARPSQTYRHRSVANLLDLSLEGLLEANAGCFGERYNYASPSCARVLATNPEMKYSFNLLDEDMDSYMMNECTAKNKFLVLELCNDITIDTLVLANFEFFSSTFRDFRASVSDRYPIKTEEWKTLGTFRALDTRNIQSFRIVSPIIWARYLRLDFLDHYGNEYYCPVSLVYVHGTTMLEEYKHGSQPCLWESCQNDILGDVSAEGCVRATEPMISAKESKRASVACEGCMVSSSEHDSIATATNTFTGTSYEGDSLNTFTATTDRDHENSMGECATEDQLTGELSKLPISPIQLPLGTTPLPGESFFMMTQNRLQGLETNYIHSWMYIKVQYHALDVYLHQIEQTQNVHVDALLRQLNTTMFNQLGSFRSQYSHFTKLIENELAQQQEWYEQEKHHVHVRVDALTEEITFQRLVLILELFLTLTCLAIIVLHRRVVKHSANARTLQLDFADSSMLALRDLVDMKRNPPRNPTTRLQKIRVLGANRRGLENEGNEDDEIDQKDIPSPYTPSFGDPSDGEFDID
ncbi:uncharacterized protein PV06_10808 [Exophiala oligosperma]|uniref:SUN domain-containing protein n=1 Tax=Exophiala oligosperma TaxID=215243 RepID=A0A0D2D0T2_9EURO|nr:uncharacterized protein PV06_10808 [Exophiala oligosperma]KIW36903.1 hypothetical protein PV06_10808 [Exophiala oligosperma]